MSFPRSWVLMVALFNARENTYTTTDRGGVACIHLRPRLLDALLWRRRRNRAIDAINQEMAETLTVFNFEIVRGGWPWDKKGGAA